MRTFSDGQNFLFLLLGNVFEFVNVIVGEFLNLGEAMFFVVLGYGFVLEHLLQMIVTVTTDVAYSRAVILKNFVDVFGELLPAIFSEGWNRSSDQPAIVGRIQTKIRSADGFFNRANQRNIIWLDGDQCGIRSGQLSYLVDRRRSAVVFDLNVIED